MSDRPNATALAIAIDMGEPALLWGQPGTGKTSAIRQLAAARNLPCEVVIASIRDPTDFAGLPVPKADGSVQLAPPSWAKNLAGAGRGLLFLDEISTAPPAVQAALLRVVLDRTVGDLALPAGVRVVAAANPPDQASGGWDLSPPLANRFLHLDWDALDAEDWGAALVSGDWPVPNGVPELPENWDADGRVRALVAAYVRARPTCLLRLPTGESEAGRAWPSPRSWAMLSRLITGARAVGAGFEVQAVLSAGCVGPGVGGEFLAFLRESNLPDPEDLLRAPETYKHPNRGDLAYAVLVAVAEAVKAAAAQGRGTIPEDLLRWAEDFLKPRVDWRRELRSAVRATLGQAAGAEDYTYRKPHRRSTAVGAVLPSLTRPVPRVAVVVDTSGSMGSDELGRARAEIDGVLRSVGMPIEVVTVDAEVHGKRTVRTRKQVELRGGGGTDMRVGFDAVAASRPLPDVLVFLTDGMTPWPDAAPRGMRTVVCLIGEAGDAPAWAHSVRVPAKG